MNTSGELRPNVDIKRRESQSKLHDCIFKICFTGRDTNRGKWLSKQAILILNYKRNTYFHLYRNHYVGKFAAKKRLFQRYLKIQKVDI